MISGAGVGSRGSGLGADLPSFDSESQTSSDRRVGGRESERTSLDLTLIAEDLTSGGSEAQANLRLPTPDHLLPHQKHFGYARDPDHFCNLTHVESSPGLGGSNAH